VYADERAAWTGPLPEWPGSVLRIEAAALDGRPVWMEWVTPWHSAEATVAKRRLPAGFVGLLLVVFGGIFAGSAVLARRNLRLGRGDRQGAGRVAVIAFVLALAWFTAAAHHTLSADEALLMARALGTAALWGLAMWVLYLVVEPFVRRRWPHLIVSWTRLIGGRARDPLVGRDLLLGGLIGSAVCAFAVLTLAAARWQHWAAYPLIGDLGALGGLAGAVASAARAVLFSFANALLFMALLVLLTVVLRRRAVALAVFFAIVLAIFAIGTTTPYERAMAFLPPIVATLLVVRLGLVAITAFHVFLFFGEWFPLTLRPGTGQGAASALAIACMLGLTAFGVFTTLGGRPFGDWGPDDD
jgi:hypothetical protein